MANEIFISYSRKDHTKVCEIKQFLDNELGINCWMDMDGIESGDLFKEVLVSAIRRHDILLFMMTDNSMNSQWTLKELNFAESIKKRIILIDLDHSPMNDVFLFDYGNKDIINWDVKLQREKLIKNIRKWLGKSPCIHENISCNSALDQNKENMLQGQTNTFEIVRKANLLFFQDQYEDAFALYLKAARLGDAEGQAQVGNCYFNGTGVNKDIKEALYWYRLAAKQNHKHAKYQAEHIPVRYSYLLK